MTSSDLHASAREFFAMIPTAKTYDGRQDDYARCLALARSLLDVAKLDPDSSAVSEVKASVVAELERLIARRS